MQEIVYGAAFKGERPIHVGFTDGKFRFKEDLEGQRPIVQAKGDGRAGSAGKPMRFAVGADDRQRTVVYKSLEQMGEWEHGIPSLFPGALKPTVGANTARPGGQSPPVPHVQSRKTIPNRSRNRQGIFRSAFRFSFNSCCHRRSRLLNYIHSFLKSGNRSSPPEPLMLTFGIPLLDLVTLSDGES